MCSQVSCMHLNAFPLLSPSLSPLLFACSLSLYPLLLSLPIYISPIILISHRKIKRKKQLKKTKNSPRKKPRYLLPLRRHRLSQSRLSSSSSRRNFHSTSSSFRSLTRLGLTTWICMFMTNSRWFRLRFVLLLGF